MTWLTREFCHEPFSLVIGTLDTVQGSAAATSISNVAKLLETAWCADKGIFHSLTTPSPITGLGCRFRGYLDSQVTTTMNNRRGLGRGIGGFKSQPTNLHLLFLARKLRPRTVHSVPS